MNQKIRIGDSNVLGVRAESISNFTKTMLKR